ncbi:YcxB family protein [Caldifermentibacillus hisashii]|uniref:YcxB family protein n=1 Tax=Caldifermentibacillus hisashii TaxID=996558 RepID=UPI0031B714DA
MNIHYRIEPEDFLALQKNSRETSAHTQKRLRLLSTLCLISVFFVFFKPVINSDIPLYIKFGHPIFQAFIWSIVIFPLLEHFLFYLKCQYRIFRLKKINYFSERNVTIDDRGITISSSKETNFFSWNHFIRMNEDPFRYYLYLSEKVIVLIKKNGSNLTEKEEKELQELFLNYTKNLTHNEIKKNIPILNTKLKIILMITYIIIMSIEYYQSFHLAELENKIEGLFEGTFSESANLILKEEITNDQIMELQEELDSIQTIGNNQILKSKLTILLDIAENQFNQLKTLQRKQTSRTYVGESENWKLESYKIEASPLKFRTYKGILSMKNTDNFPANYFKVETHLVIRGNQDIHLSERAFSRSDKNLLEEEMDLTKQSTGEVKFDGPLILYNETKPVLLEDITEVYLNIEWQGMNEENINSEKIILR